MVIYADTLFLLNALVDYLLLLASARMAGDPLYRTRMILAASAGGVYALAVVVPGPDWIDAPLCRVGVGVGMVLLSLGRGARAWKRLFCFFLLTFALGGGVLAIGTLGGTLAAQDGVIRSGMDLKVVFLSAGICYVLISAFSRRWARHGGGRGGLVRLDLRIGDRRTSFTALVDTGNTLTDPVDGRGVAVVEWQYLLPLFPQLELRHVKDPAWGMEQLSRDMGRGRVRLLGFHSVGVEAGLLLAVRLDSVKVGGGGRAGTMVALSPNPVSDGGGYHALVGGQE